MCGSFVISTLPRPNARRSLHGFVRQTLASAFLLVWLSPVFAATFTVNSVLDAHDANPGNGVCASVANQCTLRAAIEEADALGGSNTVSAPAGVYNLTLQEITISNPLNILTVTGTGALGSSIVNGDPSLASLITGHAAGIIAIVGGTVTLSNLVLQHGNPGGGDSGRGGAIFTAANTLLNITDSTIANNSAGMGGAMYAGGEIHLLRSTVRANRAVRSSGGIQLDSTTYGSSSVVDSTFSGNFANPGPPLLGSAISNGGGPAYPTVLIVNSTFSNTGGLLGNFAIFNSTIAQTALVPETSTIVTSSIIESCLIVGPHLASGGNNIEKHNTCGLNGPGDVTNTDPLLGPLQDNGGPTLTHALLPGSLAIDAGSNPQRLANDQRGPGFPRVIGAGPDIGAVETPAPPIPPSVAQPVPTLSIGAILLIVLTLAASGSSFSARNRFNR